MILTGGHSIEEIQQKDTVPADKASSGNDEDRPRRDSEPPDATRLN